MERSEHDLTTPDGTMSAYEVSPDAATQRPAVLFLMDGLGYRAELRAMADRIASAGYHVLLPDLFYRSGRQISFDMSVFGSPEKMADMRKKIGTLTSDMTMSDVLVCLDTLASRANVDASRIGIVGYCMGGRNAFIAATRFPDRIRATVSLHPGGIVTADETSPHLAAEHATARMYFGIAKDDNSFPRAAADTFEALLTKLGKNFRLEHYEARHGWAVDGTPVRDEKEAARAWSAMLTTFSEALS